MSLFDTHRPLLDGALEAIRTRGYWSPFRESPSPKVWGETAQAEGTAVIEALFGKDFPLDQACERMRVATEKSPWGIELGIRYPDCDPKALITAAQAAEPAWQAIGPQGRCGILLEALTRIHKRSFEIGHSVFLTTGQGPVMAFQAGGPHAQDRALEAVAYAWKAMADVPATARWEKPQGKNPPLAMDKQYELVGRGIALVIGCATFPTWNTYPGLFAALATGNPVIVKPHPDAVLPAALTVAILRETLQQNHLDPNVVTLALCPDPAETRALAQHPAVESIDFTGGDSFGAWLAENARQARLYAELSGVNCVVVESTDDYQGLLKNLAFSLSLYSGQMCTAPQNIFVPGAGFETNEGLKTFEQFGQDLAAAVKDLIADPRAAHNILGAIVSDGVAARVDAAQAGANGKLVLASERPSDPNYPSARLRTPAIIALEAGDSETFGCECFGPVTYLVACDSHQAALDLAEDTMAEHGALTFGVYSTDAGVVEHAWQVSRRVRVALSLNLTETVYVNQSAAYSDYHATGGNSAANASYANLAFVADRFVVVQRRRHAAASLPASEG
jgi:phenylacetic acid degradation protein paaN